MSIFNPYSYIAGAVCIAAIAGSMYYQSTQIHRYHTMYESDEKEVAVLRNIIHSMTVSQDNQKKTSDANVIRVVNGPKEIIPIISKVEAQPVDKNACVLPNYPEEVTNAF